MSSLPIFHIRIVIASVLCVIGLCGLALRQFAIAAQPWQALAAFGIYLMLAVPCSLALLLLCRAWTLAGVAGLVLAVCIAAEAPLFVSEPAPRNGVRLVVMTSNLRLGLADPSSLRRQVIDHHVDLLMLEELTTRAVARLTAAGLGSVLPYRALAPGPGPVGVGLWSRYPLRDVRHPSGFVFNVVVATVAAPQRSVPVTVMVTHLTGPWPGPATAWFRDIKRLSSVLRELAQARPSAPVLVGGDFNSTLDNAQLRAVLTNGYRDAAEQAGAGITATYPADAWYPPLIAIDHVLTRNAVATSAKTLRIRGSDHKALLAEVVLSSSHTAAGTVAAPAARRLGGSVWALRGLLRSSSRRA